MSKVLISVIKKGRLKDTTDNFKFRSKRFRYSSKKDFRVFLNCKKCKHRLKCILLSQNDAIVEKYYRSVLARAYIESKRVKNSFEAGVSLGIRLAKIMTVHRAKGINSKLYGFIHSMLIDLKKCADEQF